VCYRVHHTAEPLVNAGKEIPCYELEPLLNRKIGFQSPEYVPLDRIVNIDKPQPEYVQLKGRALREAVTEWKARREMAEGAGNGFIVKAKAEAGGGTLGTKSGTMTGWLARTFGRRRD